MFQLYAQFSDRFKLAECSLAIIHCGDYIDAPLVEALWQEIVDNGLLNLNNCLLVQFCESFVVTFIDGFNFHCGSPSLYC